MGPQIVIRQRLTAPRDYQGVAWEDVTRVEQHFIRELAVTGLYDQFHTERTADALYITCWSSVLGRYVMYAFVVALKAHQYDEVKTTILDYVIRRREREYQHLISRVIPPEDAREYMDSLYPLIGIACMEVATDLGVKVRYRQDKVFGVALYTL